MHPRTPRRSVLRLLTCVLLLAAATACSDGESASPGGVDVRVVEIEMSEMRFDPDEITVHVGETVTFRITNVGTVRHEAVFGTEEMQQAARMRMEAMDAMGGSGSTVTSAGGRSVPVRALRAHPGMGLPNMISLEPGQTDDITFRFDQPDEWLIQCHEPGHLEGGMTGVLHIVG